MRRFLPSLVTFELAVMLLKLPLELMLGWIY